jgi:hypothetical protein
MTRNSLDLISVFKLIALFLIGKKNLIFQHFMKKTTNNLVVEIQRK